MPILFWALGGLGAGSLLGLSVGKGLNKLLLIALLVLALTYFSKGGRGCWAR